MKKIIAWIVLLAVIVISFPTGMLSVVAEGELNVSFRTLDDFSGDVATEHQMAKAISTNRTEGTGSLAFTVSATQEANKSLYFYLYAVGRNPVDASGATAMIFDLYCPDAAFAAALAGFTGDGGVNLDSAAGSVSWNNSAGKISKAKGFASALQGLTVGWNHIVMPLDAAMTVTDLSKFRFFILGITLTAGTTFMIDDVRFVNDAYLGSDEYTDTNAAKTVIAAISQLSPESDAASIKSVQNQYDTLSTAQKALVKNYPVLEALVGSICVSFRTLDDFSGDVATEHQMAKAISTNRTEGTGSLAFTVSATQEANKSLYFYLYAVGRNPVDASGATAMIFDLYCPDEAFAAALAGFTGDGGVNLDSAAGSPPSWNSSAGKISKAKGFASALQGLTVGWNHIVMPLDAAMTVTDLSKFRFYILGITLTAGTTFMIDDVRFVNDAYLGSDEYTDTNAAKTVIAAISQLSPESDAASIEGVKNQYDALSTAQKALVTNYPVLEGLMAALLADPVCNSVVWTALTVLPKKRRLLPRLQPIA